jgi:hypothetical protein
MTVGDFLESKAKARQIVTYQDVITAFPHLPELQGNWNAHPLARIFEALDQEDAQKGRPFRTSLVVKKDENNKMPGNGFFEALERLKGVTCRNDAARQSAWITELNGAHQFPWP